MRWYETLAENTQRDWDALRKAILLQHPQGNAAEIPYYDQRYRSTKLHSRRIAELLQHAHFSPFIPTPAAAPPLSLTESSDAKPADILTGRVRFIAEVATSSGYISRTASNGLFEVTTDQSNALHVQIDTRLTMQPLKITVSHSLSLHDFYLLPCSNHTTRTHILRCQTWELPVRADLVTQCLGNLTSK